MKALHDHLPHTPDLIKNTISVLYAMWDKDSFNAAMHTSSTMRLMCNGFITRINWDGTLSGVAENKTFYLARLLRTAICQSGWWPPMRL